MAIRVGVGVASLPFEKPAAFFRLAALCEEGGVDSFWQTDRLVSQEPYLEALSAMAALAGATERIKFGMNAVVVPFRDPLLLAKQCASIDFLSGGRLLPVFGVGGGAAPEWKAAGIDPAGRGRRANEALEIMRRLWSEEEVSFAGEFYRFDGATIAPRPIQRPLPCWIGGNSRAAIRRTARLGTGWLAGIATAEQVGPVIAGIRAELAEVGRRIDPDHFGASLVFRFGDTDDPLVQRVGAARAKQAGGAADPRALLAVGEAGDVLAHMRAYLEAGVSKFVMIPLARGEDDVLDQTRRLIAEVIPAIEDRPGRPAGER